MMTQIKGGPRWFSMFVSEYGWSTELRSPKKSPRLGAGAKVKEVRGVVSPKYMTPDAAFWFPMALSIKVFFLK